MTTLQMSETSDGHTEMLEYGYPLTKLRKRQAATPEALQSRRAIGVTVGISQLRYTIAKRGRFWEVSDPVGRLVCLTVYKRGAEEVIRRLGTLSRPAPTIGP